MKPPKNIVVCIDSREKLPLLFPETVRWTDPASRKAYLVHVATVRKQLSEGDYCMMTPDGSPEVVALIERKGSVREICNNFLSSDYPRALAAFRRMAAATPNPILLIDCNIADFFPGDSHRIEPETALCHLLMLAQDYHIQVIFGGACRSASRRRKTGAFVVHLLLSALAKSTADARLQPLQILQEKPNDLSAHLQS